MAIANKSKVLFITRTAVLIAMLIGWQIASAPAGNTLVTGSGVNLILIISVMLSGLPSGVTVAVVSPVMAKLFGVGPLFAQLIPFQIIGNTVLVLLWHYIGGIEAKNKNVPYIIAVITAAVVKFFVLYIGVAKLAVPVILKLPEAQASKIIQMFSLPQLFTATIGGILAAMMLRVLWRQGDSSS